MTQLVQPYFTVENRLSRPISIEVDGEARGEVDRRSSESIVLASFPAAMRWEVVKQTASGGSQIGDEMGRVIEEVSNGTTVTVTNIVDSAQYFFPILTNLRDYECRVIVNDSWQSENDTGAVLAAYQEDVPFGYYKLFSNSNVTLDCGGQLRWWGVRSDEEGGTAFYDRVDDDTGEIVFVLGP